MVWRTVTVKAALASGEGMEMASEMAKPVKWRGQEEREEKVGVLLLNLGGPESLEDVQPFLYNLFADPVPVRVLSWNLGGGFMSINLVTWKLKFQEEIGEGEGGGLCIISVGFVLMVVWLFGCRILFGCHDLLGFCNDRSRS